MKEDTGTVGDILRNELCSRTDLDLEMAAHAETRAKLDELMRAAQRVYDHKLNIEAGVYADMGSGEDAQEEVRRQFRDWRDLAQVLSDARALLGQSVDPGKAPEQARDK